MVRSSERAPEVGVRDIERDAVALFFEPMTEAIEHGPIDVREFADRAGDPGRARVVGRREAAARGGRMVRQSDPDGRAAKRGEGVLADLAHDLRAEAERTMPVLDDDEPPRATHGRR